MMPCYSSGFRCATSLFCKGLSPLRWGAHGVGGAKSVKGCPKRTDSSLFREGWVASDYGFCWIFYKRAKSSRNLTLTRSAGKQIAWACSVTSLNHRKGRQTATGDDKHYSLITLSALTSTCCGTTTPICCAVFKLTKISNFDGSLTGRSPGLAPFKISTVYSAARR